MLEAPVDLSGVLVLTTVDLAVEPTRLLLLL